MEKNRRPLICATQNSELIMKTQRDSRCRASAKFESQIAKNAVKHRIYDPKFNPPGFQGHHHQQRCFVCLFVWC